MAEDFLNYRSPFSWRYGSEEMRRIWSERHKYEVWRRIWVELARAQHDAGLVSHEELEDLKKHQNTIDIERIFELEKETKHDVVAAIREFARKARIGGGKIHLGATSMDVTDNADMLRMKEAMEIIGKRIRELLHLFAEKIECYGAMPCMGWTHLQPAEPTTVGYRLACYAQDLLFDVSGMQLVQSVFMKGKGFKGAVGTGASYEKTGGLATEAAVMKKLGISAFAVTSQVYPRKADFWILTVLASIAQSVAKFAGDLRILQSPSVGEWSEPFGKKQVGSSAMPFKKNPVASEKICSLARFIAALPHVVWENAALSHLERTLDDSANRRLIMPEAFLALDEILMTARTILDGLVINTARINYNLRQYGPFSATEAIMIAAVKRGANRQETHELLRTVSMTAWQAAQDGKPNPMEQLLETNKTIARYLRHGEIQALLDVSGYTGDASLRARKLVKEIRRRMHHD